MREKPRSPKELVGPSEEETRKGPSLAREDEEGHRKETPPGPITRRRVSSLREPPQEEAYPRDALPDISATQHGLPRMTKKDAARQIKRPPEDVQALGATMPYKDSYQSEPRRVALGSALIEELDFPSRYEALKGLGAGGMGEVKLCRDKKIGREIALKSLRAKSRASQRAKQRFLQEARVQGQLEHPSIVPVYDIGVEPDGDLYFTMKRVRGMTLEEILSGCKEGDPEVCARYSRRKLLSAFSQICLAVDFTHSRGVLHRDVKPANIMLGDFGEVHLLDWGIAKILASEAESEEALELESEQGATAVGALMGTPGYMSPEQARGEHDQLDARADVYSLGAILFEILALAPLNPGDTIPGRLNATISGMDARPSRSAPEAEIPPELDLICQKATALSPEERFASARELSEALERFLDGDRDLERRKELAREHIERARALVEGAREEKRGGHQTRLEAMRALTRALALYPNAKEAAGMLAQILMEIPDEIPPQALSEMQAQKIQESRAAAKVSSLTRPLDALVILPLLAWMGVRSWPVVLSGLGVLVLSGLLNWYWWTKKDSAQRQWAGIVAFLLSLLSIGMGGLVFGPFVLIPLLCLTNGILFGIQANFKMQRWLIPLSVLPVLVPLLLQVLGLLPPFYTFSLEQILIHARFLNFNELPTYLLLLVSSTVLIIAPLVLMARTQRIVAVSERRLFLHSWHLRQLYTDAAPRSER